MTITYRYDQQKNILFETGTGRIPFKQFIEYRKRLLDIPLKDKLRCLADYTETTIKFSYRDMEKSARGSHRAVKGLKEIRLAICTESDLGYGVANIFSGIADSDEFNIKIFRTLKSARKWLGISVNDTDILLTPYSGRIG